MITAELVKELRERTGISMMDCKSALQETNGDVEQAIEVLRKKSIIKAEKKSGRTTNEGSLVVGDAESSSFLVEVKTETDFAAKDQDFKEFLNELKTFCSKNNIESCDDLNAKFKQPLLNIIQKIGENIVIANYLSIDKSHGFNFSYLHTDAKLASIVKMKDDDEEIGRDIAMQIAANNPLGISEDKIDQSILAKEYEIAKATTENENKPDDIKQKIIDGKIRKFKSENSLLEQDFIKNPELKVKDLIKDNEILAFVRLRIGE